MGNQVSAESIRSSSDTSEPGNNTARESLNAHPISRTTWLIASAAIMIEAALLRLYNLELKPLHHDEGVNGFFLTRLFREGVYEYDPTNYHGPTLYYFALVTTALLGLNTFAIRLVTALSGIGAVWLALGFRRRIGAVGALTAAALVAVSPGAVYLSRYFIHESLFVLFTLGLTVAALRYKEEARAKHLIIAAAMAALLFATKETAIISAGVLIIAALAAIAYFRIRNGSLSEDRPAEERQAADRRTGSRLRVALFLRVALLWTLAITLFILLILLLYSSFLTNPRGAGDAVKSLAIWARVGTTEHVSEWYRYLFWLWWHETPLLILGIAGAGLALWRAEDRLTIMASLWAIGLLAAYSIIPYKTPWLMLNFVIPLAIVSGYAVNAIYSQARVGAVALAIAGAAIVASLYQAIPLNFLHYDNEKYAYVYAHTQREVLPLIKEVEAIAGRAGTGEDTTISVTSAEYWPLPWYLRNYTRVGYHGRVVTFNDSIVIGSEEQEPELQPELGDQYKKVGSYLLRPGVVLVLYVRHNIIE